MDMPSESADGEYLLHIVKLHPLQEILRAPVSHSQVIYIADNADQMRLGPRFPFQLRSVLSRSPFPSMLNFRGSASDAIPHVIQRWCPGHLHRCCMKLLGEAFCAVMNNRGLRQEPSWIFSLRLQPTCTPLQFIVPTFRLLANHSMTYFRCSPAMWRQPWKSHKQTHLDEAWTTHGRVVKPA